MVSRVDGAILDTPATIIGAATWEAARDTIVVLVVRRAITAALLLACMEDMGAVTVGGSVAVTRVEAVGVMVEAEAAAIHVEPAQSVATDEWLRPLVNGAICAPCLR